MNIPDWTYIIFILRKNQLIISEKNEAGQATKNHQGNLCGQIIYIKEMTRNLNRNFILILYFHWNFDSAYITTSYRIFKFHILPYYLLEESVFWANSLSPLGYKSKLLARPLSHQLPPYRVALFSFCFDFWTVFYVKAKEVTL